MARLVLTPKAESDLYDIWATIAADNEPAADRVYNRMMQKLELAAQHPMMGSPRRDLSETARILIEGRYIAIYEPQPDGIRVIALVHGMRDKKNWL